MAGRGCTRVFAIVAVAFAAYARAAVAASVDLPACPWVAPARAPRERLVSPDATQVVAFTDADFDDIVSLIVLLKTEDVQLAAVYVVGNAWSNHGSAVRNVRNVLHMFGARDVPVLSGSYYALDDERVASQYKLPPVARFRSLISAGPGGLSYPDSMWGCAHLLPQSPAAYDPRTSMDTDEKSIPELIALVEALPSQVTLLSIGTMTPLAKLFAPEHWPSTRWMLARVEAVVVLGGAIKAPGNLEYGGNNVAEYNFYLDPHAAQYALSNFTAMDIPVTLVPLDATNDVPMSPEFMSTLRSFPRTPEAQLVGRMADILKVTWPDPTKFEREAFFWDSTATSVMLHPELVTRARDEVLEVLVGDDPFGPRVGQSRLCGKNPHETCVHVRVVYDVNGSAINRRLIELLQSPVNSAVVSLTCLF